MKLRRLLKRLSASLMPSSVLVVHGPRDKRQIALTFDDGPDERTPEYIATLDRLGARATFFLIGQNAARYPQHARALLAAGHEVLGHGYTHAKLTELPKERLQREIEMTAAVVPPHPYRALRPPGGAISATSLARTAARGYTTVLWSYDSQDASVKDPDQLCEILAPEKLSGGDIVLLHENQPWTLAALPRTISALQTAGFALVTVGEMLGW